MCLHPNYGSVEFMFQPLIRTRGKFTATNMRGADYAGDTRKDGGATFSSPSVDQEGFCYQAAKIASSKWRCRSYWTIESRIIGHGEAVAQSWLRARGSDQPQLAKKLRDNSSQNYETWGLLSLSWIAFRDLCSNQGVIAPEISGENGALTYFSKPVYFEVFVRRRK
ncbi:hypothetical protein NC653_009459 [Populus alba x Populus x berolinensis]|uniref:Uncharacterized protein n=1 Tax=Populus alba x Populus x berolinensis TaxID=444605 RepID=A0AAD6R912_9ROSI|nr:hypothetical protein NC653_009459 [Populus alba x Populus x berolinensis]